MSEHEIISIKQGRPRNGARIVKFKRLVEVLQELLEQEFTGHVKINFTQGGIGRIEKFEEILTGSIPGE